MGAPVATAAAGAAVALPPSAAAGVALPTAHPWTRLHASPSASNLHHLTHAESLNGSDSDYVLVTGQAPSAAASAPHATPPSVVAPLAAQVGASGALASAEMDVEEAAEASYMQGLLELANLLARGGAIADLAALSADGLAHGELLTPVEALALHVKALDLMSHSISLAEQVVAAAASTPPRLAPAAAEAISQAQALRARGGGLLRSAEGVRAALAAQQDHAGYLSGCEPSLGDAGGCVGECGLEGSAGGGAACGVVEAGQRTDRPDPHSVCVEEVLYRQALCMGREAAVDELLGHYESSSALYVRAKLTLEQLALEPIVCEADRAVLAKYGAGFAWRVASLRSKLPSPGTSSADRDPHPPTSVAGATRRNFLVDNGHPLCRRIHPFSHRGCVAVTSGGGSCQESTPGTQSDLAASIEGRTPGATSSGRR